MHIEVANNNGTKYLKLARCHRGTNSKGRKTIIKQTVLNIGPLSRFDDGQADYIGRLRQSFKDGKPLIETLLPYVGEDRPAEYVIRYREGDPECKGKTKLLAPCVLDPVFSALGLDSLFATIKHAGRMEYDLTGIVRLLVYGRILEPASKIATMRQNGGYFIPPVQKADEFNVYDALSVIDANADKIFRRMNTCVVQGAGRNPKVVFYDVTNFFFEIQDADCDELNDKGEVLEKGLRKFGPSKENRKQPIVQIGLFMDDDGIPISFKTFPGNTLDHHTLRPAMTETVDEFGLGRFILIADRGMYSGTNMCHVTDAGNGYIVSKSLRKSTAAERKWATSPDGYTVVSEKFRYKSKEVVRKATDENGKARTFREKVVVYWSKHFYERDRREHQSFLDFIEKLRANPSGFRVTAAQSRSLKRFMKKEVVNRKNGEVLDGTKLAAMIDDDKLNEFNELMGYYQIATSELKMPDREVIDKYHGLTQIEDQFREMKGTLETRPMFVKTKEHVRAHLMTCFIALTMMRLMQRKIKAFRPAADDEERHWSYGMSGARLSKALSGWQVLRHPGDIYQMLEPSDGDTGVVLSALGVELKPKMYTKGELVGLKSSVKAF